MSMTHHAEIRRQMRGISPLIIRCLQEYGDQVHDHHGGIICHFTKRSMRQLEHDWGREAVRRLLSDYRSAYIVISTDGTIITTGWRTERIKH